MDYFKLAAGLLGPPALLERDVVEQAVHAALQVGDAQLGFLVEARFVGGVEGCNTGVQGFGHGFQLSVAFIDVARIVGAAGVVERRVRLIQLNLRLFAGIVFRVGGEA